jgi:hypothetical protein
MFGKKNSKPLDAKFLGAILVHDSRREATIIGQWYFMRTIKYQFNKERHAKHMIESERQPNHAHFLRERCSSAKSEHGQKDHQLVLRTPNTGDGTCILHVVKFSYGNPIQQSRMSLKLTDYICASFET